VIISIVLPLLTPIEKMAEMIEAVLDPKDIDVDKKETNVNHLLLKIVIKGAPKGELSKFPS
jgi:hypothetical protein